MQIFTLKIFLKTNLSFIVTLIYSQETLLLFLSVVTTAVLIKIKLTFNCVNYDQITVRTALILFLKNESFFLMAQF